MCYIKRIYWSALTARERRVFANIHATFFNKSGFTSFASKLAQYNTCISNKLSKARIKGRMAISLPPFSVLNIKLGHFLDLTVINVELINSYVFLFLNSFWQSYHEEFNIIWIGINLQPNISKFYLLYHWTLSQLLGKWIHVYRLWFCSILVTYLATVNDTNTQGHGFHVFLQFMTREEAWKKAFDITSI